MMGAPGSGRAAAQHTGTEDDTCSSARSVANHFKSRKLAGSANSPAAPRTHALQVTKAKEITPSAAGLRIRLLKFYGMDAVNQTLEAKVGIFTYWTDEAALGKLQRLTEDDDADSSREKIFANSRPRYILPDLIDGMSSCLQEQETDNEVLKDGMLYSYEAYAGTFRISYTEPHFPYEPPLAVAITVKLRDKRYKLVTVRALQLQLGKRSQQSCIAASDVMSVAGWTLFGLPFGTDLDSASLVEWKDTKPEPIAYMVESASGEGFHSVVKASFYCCRDSTTIVVGYVIPCSLLTILTFATFAIPESLIDIQIGMSTTLLLTLLAMKLAISNEVPKTGALTFLDIKVMLRCVPCR